MVNVQEKDGLVRIGKTQIIWGSVNTTRHPHDKTNPNYRYFKIAFKSSFIAKPKITFSFLAGGNAAQGISLSQYDSFDQHGISGKLDIDRGDLTPSMNVNVDFVAIGRY